jgi:addiction module RelE/StbE family toxin
VKLRWTFQASDDLKRIRRYIARDKQEAARQWIQRLRKRARDAARMPDSGRVVPEFDRDDIREVIVDHYRIVYRIEGKEIVVLTVFEGHKLLPPHHVPGP